jgi:hypothetical protein
MLPVAVVTFGTTPTDVTCNVETAAIRHGRDDPTAQPDASTATFALVGALPAGADIGTRVQLDAVLAGVHYPRFVGEITDIEISWQDLDRPVPQIIAAGRLASMGRRVIGDVPFPTELDGTRANRAIVAAGVPTDAARTDPGTLNILARDVDAQPALTIAQETAEDGGGIVWQARDGAVLYADAEHRRAAPIALVLDSCTMPLTVAWIRNTEGLVNDVRVRYGVAPEGGEQPEIHLTEPTSIAARGAYAASISTTLAAAADANARAGAILARQSSPSWILSGVAVYLELIDKLGLAPVDDQAMTRAVLGLDVHSLISVTGLPDGSPATAANLWVEGWTEDVAWGSWRISLATSDYCRNSPEPRWDDVDASWTWNTVPDKTWDQSTCLPPPVPSGTWNDIAATLRWNQIDAAVTWNTWS